MLTYGTVLKGGSMHILDHFIVDLNSNKSSLECHHLSIVKLSVNIDLSLCDVTSQIGDWMGDI